MMYQRQTHHKENDALKKKVQAVGVAVKSKGDQALLAMTEKFDKVKLRSLSVSPDEFAHAIKHTDSQLKKAIRVAIKNITTYHAHQKKYLQQSPVSTTAGIKCYRRFSAIEKVGIYIPAGSAPLFSTVLMTCIPARLAGCKKIVLCTPPDRQGKIANEILYAAQATGCKEVYKVGGAQAIFAMAYGTKTIPAVYKIVGPGNQYVNQAKQQISSFMPIDMPAGPSEVMIIADSHQPPPIICRDLLAQLEHDPNAEAFLLTFDPSTLKSVMHLLPKMIADSPRKEILQSSIKNLKTAVVSDTTQAVNIANQYAPEHLIISTQSPQRIARHITNAGSVFLGVWAAESIGDYASGTNHTLPTSGYAKNYSGLSVESFGKWTSFQEISKQGFERIAETVKVMSGHEMLWEHQNAIIDRERLLRSSK